MKKQYAHSHYGKAGIFAFFWASIKVGFISTPMTIGKVPQALCASPESIARDLLRRPNRRGIEYLPWWWSVLMRLIRVLPAPIAAKLGQTR